MRDGWSYLIDAIKVLVIFGFLLISVLLTIWAERRVVAFMQQRIGPNRAGPFGILQGLADGVKLFFKEDIRPDAIDPTTYILAPVAAVVPAFMAFAVVPWGADVRIGHRVIPMQLADLNIGLLFFLAMGSLMVYGVVLAGWSSGSSYPLLGAVRSSAQMLSYELGMGMAAVAVTMAAGTLSARGIVDAQAGTWLHVIPHWFVFSQFPAFLLFLLTGLAETNRAPFDLPEAETELVAGFHTEYSGIKFATFFLAEYLHVITTLAIATTIFLGGWRGPILPFFRPIWPIVWFLAKTGFFVFLFMWARATLPRVRYDRLMRIGWKVLVPAGLAWIMITGVLVVVPSHLERSAVIAVVGLLAALGFVVYMARTTKRRMGSLSPGKLKEQIRGIR
ncbi:MAG: NADH-quinone oxidoreductase subunit NuoH [Actinomycetota bacterium]